MPDGDAPNEDPPKAEVPNADEVLGAAAVDWPPQEVPGPGCESQLWAAGDAATGSSNYPPPPPPNALEPNPDPVPPAGCSFLQLAPKRHCLRSHGSQEQSANKAAT